MGRSLLKAPHGVLLEQLEEDRLALSTSTELCAAIAEAGVDVGRLLADLDAAIAGAREAGLASRLAADEVARGSRERAAWCRAVTAWFRALRPRLKLAADPRAAAAVRAAFDDQTGRRFESSIDELRLTLHALRTQAAALDLGAWHPDPTDEGEALLTAAAGLQEDRIRAADARALTAVRLATSTTLLQQRLRQVAGAVAIARQHVPLLPPLPREALGRYLAKRPPRTGTVPDRSGSDPDSRAMWNDRSGNDPDSRGMWNDRSGIAPDRSGNDPDRRGEHPVRTS